MDKLKRISDWQVYTVIVLAILGGLSIFHQVLIVLAKWLA